MAAQTLCSEASRRRPAAPAKAAPRARRGAAHPSASWSRPGLSPPPHRHRRPSHGGPGRRTCRRRAGCRRRGPGRQPCHPRALPRLGRQRQTGTRTLASPVHHGAAPAGAAAVAAASEARHRVGGAGVSTAPPGSGQRGRHDRARTPDDSHVRAQTVGWADRSSQNKHTFAMCCEELCRQAFLQSTACCRLTAPI
jgi:hypothetical protein